MFFGLSGCSSYNIETSGKAGDTQKPTNAQSQKSIAVLMDLAEQAVEKLNPSRIGSMGNEEIKKLIDEIVQSFKHREVRIKRSNYPLCCDGRNIRGFEADVVIGELRESSYPFAAHMNPIINGQPVPVVKPGFIS
jgi:hypothetical protein